VPGISGPPIPAGDSADYDFPLAYGGTFWMHSHEGLQEQQLLLAPLIIRERDRPDQQEVVLMLNDFSFTPPEEIFANLKKGSSMPVMAERRMKGIGGGAKPMPASMKDKGDMKDMAGVAQSEAPERPDLNDVTYDAFLANDRTFSPSTGESANPRRASHRGPARRAVAVGSRRPRTAC
jgi:FtsP/CotA-like multicopper oxidase with cupredoxin domain